MDSVSLERTLAFFETLLAQYLQARVASEEEEEVPFEVFEGIISQVQEHSVRCMREQTLEVLEKEGLGTEERSHGHELSIFHEAFMVASGGSDGINRPQLQVLLADFGLHTGPDTQ